MIGRLAIKFLLAIIISTYFPVHAQAQAITVSGLIKLKDGSVLPSASVRLKDAAGNILSFTSTDDKGGYSLRIPSSTALEKLYIEVNYLGLKKSTVNLQPSRLEYNFVMESAAIELADIKIKSKPILNAKGDTLSYNVRSFSQENDRSIGDVLKRMPGIEVEENGRIKYNGRNISNMYIGGDDLLDGKYALGTRTIPLDVIQSVDVMQNHQPIKVIQNRVQSDDVALNLVIKDEANLSLSGQAMLGGGLPQQYDAALNTILFNKKFKMLNVLQANDIGLDYRRDLQNLGTNGFLAGLDSDKSNPLISSGTVQEPDLPQKRYYLNNSLMVNANNLRNYSNGLQLKSNLNFLLDRNRFSYSSFSDYTLSDSIVRYTENQSAVQRPIFFGGTIKAMLNKDKYFLNNDLKINLGREATSANMSLNGLNFDQKLKTNIRDFSNDFRYSPLLKSGNVLDISWRVNFFDNPQYFQIDKGLNPLILNNDNPYMSLSENITSPLFSVNGSVSYRLISRTLRQNYKISAITETHRLNSRILLTPITGEEYPYAGDSGNNIIWKEKKFSAFAGYEWKKERLEVTFNFPLSYQIYNFSQQLQEMRKNFLVIAPAAKIKIRTSAEDFLQLNGNFNRDFGDISSIYRGAILTSYRTLQSNSGELKDEEFTGASIFYNFQRSLSMFFMNGGINYNRISSNTISTILLDNSIERSLLVPFDNNIDSWTVKAGISKYLFFINTTASLKMSWSLNQYKQFYNNEPADFNNEEKFINLGLESKILKRINLSYNGSGRFGKSYSASENSVSNTVNRFDQNLSVSGTLFKKINLSAKGRQITTKRSGFADISYLFTDLSLKWKLTKLKADLDVEINNLSDIKNYQLIQIENNRLSYGNYQLRGINGLLRATFFL